MADLDDVGDFCRLSFEILPIKLAVDMVFGTGTTHILLMLEDGLPGGKDAVARLAVPTTIFADDGHDETVESWQAVELIDVSGEGVREETTGERRRRGKYGISWSGG